LGADGDIFGHSTMNKWWIRKGGKWTDRDTKGKGYVHHPNKTTHVLYISGSNKENTRWLSPGTIRNARLKDRRKWEKGK
jgi:hypothetical protein